MNRVTEFAQRRPGLTGAVGAMAAMAVALGGYTATACSCVFPIGTTTTGTTTTVTTVTTTTTNPSTLGGVTTANLWITSPGDPQGSCQESPTKIGYLASRSCGASNFLDQAVSNAAIGDTIGVPGGTYTGMVSQLISYESRLHNTGCDPLGTWGAVNTASCIRFAPQLGTRVFFPNAIQINTGGIWIDGSTTGTITAPKSRTYSFHNLAYIGTEIDSPQTTSQYPDYVTITGFDTSALYALGSQHVRFSNDASGGWHFTAGGGCRDAQALDLSTGFTFQGFEPEVGSRLGVTDSNIVFDHTYLHNINSLTPPDCPTADVPHGGCMFLHNGVDGLTFNADVWEQCWVYDIQIQGSGGSTNVLVENSWIGVGVNEMRDTGNETTPGQRGIQFDDFATNYTFRNNSFSQDGSASCQTGGCSYTNVKFIGNSGAKPGGGSSIQPCGGTGVSSTQNVWTPGQDGAGTCGGSDVTSSPGLYVSDTPGTMNYALSGSPGSTAADSLVTAGTGAPPSPDIFGTTVGAAPWDAGAQQR